LDEKEKTGLMKTLGISMIVRNESAMIRTCLESVKEADEIVISSQYPIRE
jgi:hypothetical protein